MYLNWKTTLALVNVGCVGLVAALPDPSLNLRRWNDTEDVITRDVCIIGGGATGTYAAVQLRESNHSVVVVERSDRLGGHTQTYTDSGTGAPIDYGVVVWEDLPIVKEFFARFNISLRKEFFASTGVTAKYADFRTGEIVANFTPSDPRAALAAYGAQLAQYSYLEAGFDLPYPVPDDLLLPFGEFVTKYSLGGMVQTVFGYGQGLGNLLHQPTLYVFKNFGLGILRDIQAGFLTTTARDNSAVYRAATAFLGSDALLSTTAISMNRESEEYSNVAVEVLTPSGPKIIKAKKILVTIPPKLSNLEGFDLSDNETAIFSQFSNSAYYTGILRNSGIPDNVTVSNAIASSQYQLPILPGVYALTPTGVPGLVSMKYGSPFAIDNDAVKADVLNTLRKLQATGAVATTNANTTEFAAYGSHTPFELTVPTEAISDGFYRDLYALQGQRNTFYTGATFHTHNSALLWQFTRGVVEELIRQMCRYY